MLSVSSRLTEVCYWAVIGKMVQQWTPASQQLMCVQELAPDAVGWVQHGLLRRVLTGHGRGRRRGRRGVGGVPGAGPSAPEKLQAAVLTGLLRGQWQVKQVRQRRNVIQVTQSGGGAPTAVGPAQALLTVVCAAATRSILPGQRQGLGAHGSCALLGLLVLLNLGVEAVPLLLWHATKFDSCRKKTNFTTGDKLNMYCSVRSCPL